MSVLLEASGIGKEFAVESGILRRRVGAVRALDNVSFQLKEGTSLGLVGESGSGKTTLARLVTRTLEATQGWLLWQGQPVNQISPRAWALRVQMVFQDPSSSLNPKLHMQMQLTEAVCQREILSGRPRPGRAALQTELAEILRVVGLAEDVLPRYPHQFSGGQKQRLAIARALAMKPRLLVADEPVSALDLSIQAQILNLLMDLKEQFQLTMIVISHDLAVISRLADDVLVLKDGRAVESGPTPEVLAHPKQPYTQALVDAVPPLVR